jgi:hypothetical protein
MWRYSKSAGGRKDYSTDTYNETIAGLVAKFGDRGKSLWALIPTLIDHGVTGLQQPPIITSYPLRTTGKGVVARVTETATVTVIRQVGDEHLTGPLCVRVMPVHDGPSFCRTRKNAVISNLAELVAPLGVDAFHALLRERSPVRVRGAGIDRHASLLDWSGMMETALSGTYPASKLVLTKRGNYVPGALFRTEGKPRRDVIERLMAAGASMVAYGIERHMAALGDLCASISAETGEHVIAGAVATTGAGGALGLHYDDSDILVVQVDGRKRWLIESNPAINPVAGLAVIGADGNAECLLDVTLDPGDLLLVPAGFRHRCDTQDERSLHLAFSFHPLTKVRALDLLMRRLREDPAHRTPLRFDKANREEVEASLRQELIEQIDSLSLIELIAQHRTVDLGLK